MNLELFEFNFKALGSDNEIKLFAHDDGQAQQAASAIINECMRIDNKFSRYKPDSIVSIINQSAAKTYVLLDEETAGLLDYASACYKQSEGLFDITSGILRKIWNFKQNIIPSQEQIDELLPLIGWDKVLFDKKQINLPFQQMEIDLGGIGKEYAVDRSIGIAWEHQIKSGFVNLGGDLRVIGPRPDGTAWRIGIKHPRDSNSMFANVQLLNGALATSGDYERFIEINDERYGHILNPKTGWPVQGLSTISVIADSCLVAGSLATLAMLFGPKKGINFLKSQNVQFIV